jgi:16S rRNA processing protein RimM
VASPARLVLLGVFGAARGMGGELRVKSFTADPKAIGRYGALTDKSGTRAFHFEAVRAQGEDMLAVRLAGVATREAAEALTGVEIYARREQLPPPAADEFYYDDLVGLAAVTRAGLTLGRVVALSNHGAGDILEIAPDSGGETLLLPFSKAVAVEIDFAGGRIVVEPPREIDGEAEGQNAVTRNTTNR